MSKCTTCKEYDKDKHYCPKWCDVIKGTIEDARADERAKTIEEFKNFVNDRLRYYQNEYRFRVTYEVMVDSILNEFEQLKEQK